MKKVKKFEAYTDTCKLIIEEDLPDVGAYLYVFENEICVKDFLQDSIEICEEIALDEYSVSFQDWVEILH